MNNATRTQIIALLEAVLPSDGFAVLYGSCKPDADIDVLLVQESPPVASCLVLGRLDVVAIDCREANKLADALDPLVIEPLLTGHFIHGKPGLYNDLKDLVAKSAPSLAGVEHLSRRCFEELCATERILHEWDTQQNEVCRWAFQNLSYSISYGSLARYYSSPDAHVSTLKELIDHDEVYLPDFWRCREQMKQSRKYPATAVKEWLALWKMALLKTK